MILKLIDDKIRRAFSDAAVRYDVLTGLHKEIGRELLKKITGSMEGVSGGVVAEPTSILDVGSGTGWSTVRIKTCFPEARVVGIDAAEGMVEAARRREEGLQIVQADAARLPFKKETFDLIFSNLAYQWVSNPAVAFTECYRVLRSNGKLYATIFGYHTFQELFDALMKTREVSKKDICCARLASKEEMSVAFHKAGFPAVRLEGETIRVHFPDMMAIVQWVKDIGANTLMHPMSVGRDWLNRANDYYLNTFHDRWGVYATFEVIWVEVGK